MVTALARAVLAFHAVKLAGLAANLVMFPVLRPQAAAPQAAARRPAGRRSAGRAPASHFGAGASPG